MKIGRRKWEFHLTPPPQTEVREETDPNEGAVQSGWACGESRPPSAARDVDSEQETAQTCLSEQLLTDPL